MSIWGCSKTRYRNLKVWKWSHFLCLKLTYLTHTVTIIQMAHNSGSSKSSRSPNPNQDRHVCSTSTQVPKIKIINLMPKKLDFWNSEISGACGMENEKGRFRADRADIFVPVKKRIIRSEGRWRSAESRRWFKCLYYPSYGWKCSGKYRSSSAR